MENRNLNPLPDTGVTESSDSWQKTGAIKVQKLLDACFQAKQLTEQLPVLPDRLSRTHNRILNTIAQLQNRDGGCRTSDVARFLNITMPSITRTIRDLENKGFVEKTEDENDRRASLVHLTEKGESYYRRYILNFHSSWAEGLSDLSMEDIENFIHVLNRFQQAMPADFKEKEEEKK